MAGIQNQRECFRTYMIIRLIDLTDFVFFFQSNINFTNLQSNMQFYTDHVGAMITQISNYANSFHQDTHHYDHKTRCDHLSIVLSNIGKSDVDAMLISIRMFLVPYSFMSLKNSLENTQRDLETLIFGISSLTMLLSFLLQEWPNATQR